MKKLMTILLCLIPMFSLTGQVYEQWMHTYNGTGNNTDVLTGMVLDDAGNIYVTGYTRSGSSQSTEDFGTIKYLADGTREWIRKYDGPTNQRDYAKAIGVDYEGNVYVTGASEGHSILRDYATVKYDSEGNFMWVRTYNSPAEPSEWIDIPYAIAVSQTGVFVTGISYIIGYGNYITTIKYGFNGTEMWVSRYQGYYVSDKGISIATDNAGNCFVGVHSDAGSAVDYTVIKYNAAGEQEWASTYDGPANAADILNSITVDASGNVYATGRSHGGFVTGSGYDIVTVKFSAGGSTDWVARYNGFANMNDAGNSVVYANNYIYVTGYVQQSPEARGIDVVLIKYGLSGSLEWAQYYNSSKNYQDYGISTAVDKNDNVYLTGSSAESDDSDYQVCFIKYSSDGSEQWVQNSGRINTSSTAIALDTSSNIIVAGYGDNFPGNSDYLLLKYGQGNLTTNYFSNGSLDKPINDNQNTYDVINVNLSQNNQNIVIQKAVIVLDSVLHTNDSDLEFYITHNGISDTLIFHAGDTGSDFLNTRLDDNAITSVQDGAAPFAGRFKPFSSLDNFIGSDPDGDWTLTIFDNTISNTGTLKKWHLEITYAEPTGIETISSEIPEQFTLYQNYPNPFNPSTKIKYSVPSVGTSFMKFVQLKVYDALGNEIATLVNEEQPAGEYEVEFSAKNVVASGIYFYQLNVGSFTQTKKMILLR